MAYKQAPSLDPDFLAYEQEEASKHPEPLPTEISERQSAYAQRCRDLYRRMVADGARDHHLDQGIAKKWINVSSTVDGFGIPVMQLDLDQDAGLEPKVTIIYYHGGGLAVGEADSEELSCRHMVKAGGVRTRLYSVGYRLRFPHGAETCMADARDCFNALRSSESKVIVTGSSSGGQLAAAISQEAPEGSIHGVLLRGPVTGDAHSGLEYIPEKLRSFHTSVSSSFLNSMSSYLGRNEPRDGLKTLPIEAESKVLRKLPKTWIQISTNDTLYSDGLCYAIALQEAGVEVHVDVIHGWPHTFWLVAPWLDRANKAEKDMVEGLRWLMG